MELSAKIVYLAWYVEGDFFQSIRQVLLEMRHMENKSRGPRKYNGGRKVLDPHAFLLYYNKNPFF